MSSPETLYMFPSSMVRSDELDSFGDHLKKKENLLHEACQTQKDHVSTDETW